MMPDKARAAAEPRSIFSLGEQQNVGKQFWYDQKTHRAGEDPGRANRISGWPLRKQRKSLCEIFRTHELGLQRDESPEHQKHKPQRRS